MMAGVFLAGHGLFMVWAVFFGGAARIEGGSSWVVHPLGPCLSARLLAAYIVFSWLAHLAIVLLAPRAA